MIELITIKKCLRGNQAAFKKAYNDSLPYVLSIVRRYIYDEGSRPDAVQEIYIQLFNNLDKYDPKRGEVKSFVRTVAVNKCISLLRKKSNKPILQSLSVVEENNLADDSEQAILSLKKEDILKLLADMPDGYRVIFMLFSIDGYSHKEIAEKLKITSETSRSQYFRAKKWLVKTFNKSSSIKSYGTI